MKTGCKKCQFTGFAFGKIPCQCTDLAHKGVALVPTTSLQIGDIVYYKGELLGECTEVMQLSNGIMAQVKVPRFMGYGASPELSCDYVNVQLGVDINFRKVLK